MTDCGILPQPTPSTPAQDATRTACRVARRQRFYHPLMIVHPAPSGTERPTVALARVTRVRQTARAV